jgi:hypothetical protein
VSGTVHFSLEDSPVEGAVVKLGDVEVTTNANGSFSVPELPREVVEGRVVIDGFPDHEFSVDLSDTIEVEEYVFSIEVPATRATFVLEENAHEPQTVFDFALFVGGVELDHVELGEDLQTDIIAPGIYKLRLSSDIYESFEEEVEFFKGEHLEEIELNLTLDESYRRFNQSNALHRYAQSYNFIHPDVRELLSLVVWEGTHNPRADVINAAPELLGVLEEWSSELTGKDYQDVTRFRRSFITEYGDSRRASRETQHWVLQSGRWYIVYPERFW